MLTGQMNKKEIWVHKERVPDDTPCECECTETDISFCQNHKAGYKYWDAGTRKVRKYQTTDKQVEATKIQEPQREDGEKGKGDEHKATKGLRQKGVDLGEQTHSYLRWLRGQETEGENDNKGKQITDSTVPGGETKETPLYIILKKPKKHN